MENRVVSSNTSEVFHKFTCRYATNLNETNSETFGSYELAVKAGLRPCKTCKPEPTPDPPVDPNIVVIEPTIEATNLFPINGMVIQAEYCGRAMEPNDIGVRIIKPIITYTTVGAITNPVMCSKCITFNHNTGEGNVPQEHVVPIYNPTPTDPNVPEIIEYNLSSSTPVFVSNQSRAYHIHPDCEFTKSVPVHVVNMRTGLIAGSNAYWNPIDGIIEWRVSPFEAGDYSFVMNTDVGQTSLLAITIRAKRMPNLQDFTARWLKGNFNLLKYSEWLSNQKLWNQYLGRIVSKTGSITPSSGSIEWVFSDGRWVPVTGGSNIVTQYDADAQITENNVVSRETRTIETKIAPFEWRTSEVRVITTDTTKFTGYTAYSARPPAGSTDYLLKPPYGDPIWEGHDPNEAEMAIQLAAHYEEIEVAPPPEEVAPPKSFDATIADANSIRSFTALPTDMRMAASSAIIDTYIAQKKAYEAYIIKKAEWEKDMTEKEMLWHQNMQADHEPYHMRHSEAESEYAQRSGIAESIAQFYAATINGLNQTEKDMLLHLRRKILDGDIDIEAQSWQAVMTMMEAVDEAAASNIADPNSVEETETP
jgi:hypothetical protein